MLSFSAGRLPPAALHGAYHRLPVKFSDNFRHPATLLLRRRCQRTPRDSLRQGRARAQKPARENHGPALSLRYGYFFLAAASLSARRLATSAGMGLISPAFVSAHLVASGPNSS